MADFALLVRESANRVYAGRAADLLVAELEAISPRFHTDVTDVRIESFGGVEYVVFSATEPDDHDRFLASNLSTTRALFEAEGDGRLRPLDLSVLAWFPSDLITIQRYRGKTNEQFTHLLLNVTVAMSDAATERSAEGSRVRVVDPVAGRGTSLNRALAYGYDATGIELEKSHVDEYRNFISNYLKNNRVKHKLQQESVRKGALAGSGRFTVTIGTGQHLEVVRGDAGEAVSYLPNKKFDVLVADLPYGVQHRSDKGGRRDHSPAELLQASLTGWREMLRDGAAIGLAWNTKTLRRDALQGLLEEHGFEPIELSASFEHQVDRSVTRDLVIARR